MIKIFGTPSHASIKRTSGVDFVRVVQPMEHLDKLKDFKVTIYQPRLNEKMDWLTVTEENDILFLNYTTNPWAFAIMGAIARKHKRKIVMDLDDALWHVLPDNHAFEVFKQEKVMKDVTAICNEVDYVTCTNRYLRNVIVNETMKRHDRIKVVPNYIDFNLYKHRSPFKDTLNVQLTHFGSSSHYESLNDVEFAKGVDRIMREYPNVTFKTIGCLVHKFKSRWGHRYSHGFGDWDVYKWVRDKMPDFMDETDIMVTPLTNNLYNRSKSSTKFNEASSAVKPGVWQKIRQYEEVIEDGKNGFLAETADQWYQAIKKLVDDKELRRKMGKAAFKTVEKDWQIQDHVQDLASFFREVLDS